MCFAWLGMEAVGLRLCILVNIPQLYHHLARTLLMFMIITTTMIIIIVIIIITIIIIRQPAPGEEAVN